MAETPVKLDNVQEQIKNTPPPEQFKIEGQPVAAPPQIQPQSSGLDPELEAALFAPTQFPDEPVTHGAFGGEGPDFVKLRNENDDQFLTRVADTLQKSKNSVGSLVPYLDRLRRGL